MDSVAQYSVRVVTLCMLCLLVQTLRAHIHYEIAKLLDIGERYQDPCEPGPYPTRSSILESPEELSSSHLSGVRDSRGNGSKSEAKEAAYKQG